MNLNSDISFNFDPAKAVGVLTKLRGALITVIIAGLVGYTGLQLSKAINVKPDATYLNKQQSERKTTRLRTTPEMLNQLKSLQSAGDTSITVSPGKQDPFDLRN